jgi:hypothetical protein
MEQEFKGEKVNEGVFYSRMSAGNSPHAVIYES